MILTDAMMWTAVQQKTQAYDGKFYYGVLTTGVFCRPSCPARLPLQKNVRFYTNTTAAHADGLRACKRCKPLEQPETQMESQLFQELCRYMEEHRDEAIPLKTLSKLAKLSPEHLQRRFKAVIGISPKQYLEACRLRKFKEKLHQGNDITTAIYDAGFSSNSRLYEKLDTRLGMTPTQYRSGGKGLIISYASADISVGHLMIGATDRGLCFLQLGPSVSSLLKILKQEYPQAQLLAMKPESKEQFDKWMGALEAYVSGQKSSLDLPLDIQGTAFQRKVWHYLQQIPYGEVQSYTEVAAGIGQPKAARAVASACAANNLAIVIPCHRVLRGTGELGGYRWGLELKQALLDQERKKEQVHTD